MTLKGPSLASINRGALKDASQIKAEHFNINQLLSQNQRPERTKIIPKSNQRQAIPGLRKPPKVIGDELSILVLHVPKANKMASQVNLALGVPEQSKN